MRRAAFPALLVLGLALGADPLRAQSSEPQVQPPQEPPRLGTELPLHPEEPDAAPALPQVEGDPREVELLLLDCQSELEHHEITLFASGTVRRREGPPGKERMGLAELGPDGLAAAVRRLEAEDLSEVRDLPRTIEGAWQQACAFFLTLPGRASHAYRFGKADALPLPLSRLLAIAEDVGGRVDLLEGEARLPEGYAPAPGDRLRRADGVLFEIHAFTDDGKGIELRGVEQPLTIYLRKEDLRQLFVAVEPRFGAEPR